MTNLSQSSGDLHQNIRSRRLARIAPRRAKIFVLLGSACLALTMITACAETGDFGRRHPGLFEGKAGIDWPPSFSASRFSLTEDETEFRKRALTMLRNPQSPQFPTLDVFEAVIANDARVYYERVAGTPDQSVMSRYHRVMRDAEADRMLIPPLRAVACRIAQTDQARLAALDVAEAVSDDDKQAAKARVQDNAALGQAVEQAFVARANAYHDALERLYVISPDAAIKPALAEVKALQAEIDHDHTYAMPALSKRPLVRKR